MGKQQSSNGVRSTAVCQPREGDSFNIRMPLSPKASGKQVSAMALDLCGTDVKDDTLNACGFNASERVFGSRSASEASLQMRGASQTISKVSKVPHRHGTASSSLPMLPRTSSGSIAWSVRMARESSRRGQLAAVY